jgi:PAP2 superfamily
MLQWMPWQDAAGMAGATAATWRLTDRSPRRWARRLKPWARELTLTLILYGMWQYAGAWSLGRVNLAVARGQNIWHLERLLHLPSERSAQQLILHHRLLVHWLNEFYVQLHVPSLGVCLLWLFIRHRDRYPNVRNVLVLTTGACLLIQMFPVAPPRLLPHAGIVDTGALVGPSDYAGGAPGIDQLSAMPSVHVAWALIVAGAIVWASRNRYRWLAVLYPAMTILVVVVTGNHYWADAIVAAALCALATYVVVKVPAWWMRLTGVEAPERNVPVGTLPVGTLDSYEPDGEREPIPLRDSS